MKDNIPRKKSASSGFSDEKTLLICRISVLIPYILVVQILGRTVTASALETGIIPLIYTLPSAILGALFQSYMMRFSQSYPESDNLKRDMFVSTIVSIVLAFIAGFITSRIIVFANVHSHQYSFFVILSAIVTFLAFFCGALVFTLPAESFFSSRSAYTFIVIIISEVIVSSFFLADVTVYAVLAITFFFTALFIGKTQENIRKVSKSSRVLGISANIRQFGFKTSLVFLALIPVVFIPIAAAINGIVITAKSLFMLVTYWLTRDAYSAGLTEEQVEQIIFSDAVFKSVDLNKAFFIIFWILLAALIIYLLVRKKIKPIRFRFSFRAIVAFFKELWSRFISWLFSLKRIRYEEAVDNEIKPFSDEVFYFEDIGRDLVSTHGNSLHEFNSKLNSLEDSGERFRFAYAVLVSQFVRMGIPSALTPREMCNALSKTGRYSVEGISEIYEIICYAENIPPRASSERELARICFFVKSNFESIENGTLPRFSHSELGLRDSQFSTF
ncbi:MAG: hypothetical protein E7633_05860 [Ruminococcaceae bacterium]|nr:hypothetical protein [Oscillospiraceae bacterium]